MTSIAIIGLDRSLAVSSLVLTVVAAETARPIFMANIIRIGFPTGVHLREEVVFVDLLNDIDDRVNLGIIRIGLGERGRNSLHRPCFVRVGTRQREYGVGFNKGK